PNEWYAEIRAVPAGDVIDGTGLNNGQIRTGIVAFTPDGRLDTTNTTLFPNPADPTIDFGADAAAAPGAGLVNWAPGPGVSARSVRFGLNAAAGGLTQFDCASGLDAARSNGTTFANRTTTPIDEHGFLTEIYDN